MKHSVTELPFNQFLGIQTAGEVDASALRLPSGGQYLNHLGTVHASALLALAEAASGEYLLRTLGEARQGVLPVVRHLEAKFRKPARGAVTSSASASPEALSQLSASLEGKGRGLITVSVELHDESGTQVLNASVEWFLQKLAEPLPQG